MSDSSQIALIRKLYDARGNVNTFKSLLADDLEYDICVGFPNGGVYRGIDSVVKDFFTFIVNDFDEFYAEGDEYFESGDHVIVLGRYFGVTKKGRTAWVYRKYAKDRSLYELENEAQSARLRYARMLWIVEPVTPPTYPPA